MPSVVDSLSLISKTMESILDFVAQDEALSNDFQQYLELNNIEIETEKEFNNVIIQYMLDMKMLELTRVKFTVKKIDSPLKTNHCGFLTDAGKGHAVTLSHSAGHRTVNSH